MPVFKIETKDGAFEIEAPDENAALSAFKQHVMGGAKPQADPFGSSAFDAVAAKQQPGEPGALRQGVLSGELMDSGRPQPQVPEQPQQPQQRSIIDEALGYVGTAADGIAQGLTFGTSDELAAGFSTGFGLAGDYGKALKQERQRMATNAENYPLTSLAGNVAGAIIGPGKYSQLGKVANKGLGTRAMVGAGEGALMGAAYGAGSAEEGDRLASALTGGAFGGLAGGAMPVVGAGLRKGYEGARGAYQAIAKPREEAARRITQAYADDAASGRTLSRADISKAQASGAPITVADLGGEQTRSLARSAGNLSAEARDKMALVSDRVGEQGERSINMIKTLMNGQVDDLAVQEGLEAVAKKANKAAYDAAYAFNYGKSGPPMELDGILQRIPASAISNAMKIAKAEGRPFGKQLVASIDEASNTVTFARMPSLQELDSIQRGLRAATTQVYKSGASDVGNAYKGLRRELLDVMDSVNPAFQKARQGAAAAFGAEDALEAGRKTVMLTRKNSEIARDFMKLKDHEKDLFRIGYASELIDKIKSVGDRTNTINAIFGKSQEREKMALIFGPRRMREIEAFVRVENMMQKVNVAIGGNSSTARQLGEMAMAGVGVGGVSAYMTGGDITTSIMGGIAGAAGKAGRNALNERLAKEVAELLMSGDPKKIQMIVQQAATNQTTMATIKALEAKLIALALPAGVAGATSLASQ